jgi:hypothetical protein
MAYHVKGLLLTDEIVFPDTVKNSESWIKVPRTAAFRRIAGYVSKFALLVACRTYLWRDRSR